MKRALPVFLIALVAGVALGAGTGPRLASTQTYHLDLQNCDGGVTATPIAEGNYTVSIKDEGVYLCTFDAGCATGGQWYPANLVQYQNFSGAPISCRSDGMTGDISMTLNVPGI